MKHLKNIGALLLFTVLALSFLAAQGNLTQGNVTSEKAVCSEQLNLCIEEYNTLLKDFRGGANCNSTTFETLRYFNQVLADERDSAREAAGESKAFKSGFYAVFALFILSIIICFVLVLKRANGSNGDNQEDNNDRRDGRKAKGN